MSIRDLSQRREYFQIYTISTRGLSPGAKLVPFFPNGKTQVRDTDKHSRRRWEDCKEQLTKEGDEKDVVVVLALLEIRQEECPGW